MFNVSLKFPNWHQQTDKTFDLQLTDAQYTHQVFLTHLTFDPVVHGLFILYVHNRFNKKAQLTQGLRTTAVRV